MPDTIITVLAVLSLLCWLHLCWGRSGFWRADHRLPAETPELQAWPVVAAVIPARNEAESIGRAVRSLLAQDSANVRRLVAKGEIERRDLVSLMVRLRCQSFWERLLVPAFVFFFKKLFPFPRVNDSARPEAAAAGGCMLVRRGALEAAGGIGAIRDRLIDDCALAARIKSYGSIWLGLAEETRSLRPYPRLRDFWAMVARTAYTQLEHSPLQLAITIVVMSVMYLLPAIVTGSGLWAGNLYATALGMVASLIMISTFRPTLTLYDMPLGWSLALPLAAVLYILMTIDSARRTWQGRGGFWKGQTFERGLRADLSAE